MATKRISDEPAFILHQYDWSESSLILEVFTRHYGRVALVARGAKKPTSNFRPVLLPLQPLRLTYTIAGEGHGDIHALKGAEWVGGHVLPSGDALLSGLYLNELMLRLLAREDTHAPLFDTYAGVLHVLASEHGDALEPVLRSFELVLLRDIGLLPDLHVETATLTPLSDAKRYALVAEGGLRMAAGSDRSALSGAQWLDLHSALVDGSSNANANANAYTATLRALVNAGPGMASELKPQLRALLQYHCGSPMLRTRQLMMDLQSL